MTDIVMNRIRAIRRSFSGGGWAAMSLGLLLMLGGRAIAASDSTVISVTPGNIIYGVVITSPVVNGTTGYDFTQVNLGATTISTLAIHVQNAGNASEYFAIAVSNSRPDGWTPINSGTPGFKQFQLLGHLVPSGGSQPASSSFDVNADTITTAIPSTAAGRYGQTAQTDPGVTSDLWLQLMMPSAVSSENAQSMTLTINGQAN